MDDCFQNEKECQNAFLDEVEVLLPRSKMVKKSCVASNATIIVKDKMGQEHFVCKLMCSKMNLGVLPVIQSNKTTHISCICKGKELANQQCY